MTSPAGEEFAQLRLESLAGEFPHIPPAGGTMMAQAAMVCLDHEGHRSPARLVRDGTVSGIFTLTWSEGVTEAVRRFWNDLPEATQQGAYAVAILVMRALLGYTVVERSRKGTGFDWWLGTEDNLFQGKARLEVSGILRGNVRRVNSRIAARRKQTMRSDILALPAYIVVIEFSTPRGKVVEP